MQTILILFGVVGYASANYMYCNLFTGSGCSDRPGFDFTSNGTTSTPNSLCNKNYQVTVTLYGGANGFYCYYYMDRPEQFRYVYSMAHSTTSAHIYGRGKDATITGQSTSSSLYGSNSITWNNAHSHYDDNNYSWIRWTLTNNKVNMYGTDQDRAILGNPYFLRPASSSVKLGLNRHHTYGSLGSGLCRVYCRFTYPSVTSSRTSVRGRPGAPGPSGNTAGSGIDGDDPEGNTAPSPEDLNALG